MIDKTLTVQKREGRGKGASGRLRAKDLIPGVFYTASGENILVQAPELPLEKMYEKVGRTTVFNLEIESEDGKTVHPVLIWQVQRHPYKKRFTHIDYYGVDLDKEIKVVVPLEFTGVAPGVKLGGVMEIYREDVRLSGKPLDIPQKVVVDVSKLNIGDNVNVGDLALPPNVHSVYDRNYAIVSVLAKGKADAAEEEEAAAAPAPK